MSQELTLQDEDDIILPPALQDFTTPQELRKALVAFKKLCEANNQVRTLPGLCRALNISKEEYLTLRNGEYKKELEQMEMSIKHECINKGIKSAGVWKYLENEFPNEYRKEGLLLTGDMPLPIMNLSVHFHADKTVTVLPSK